MTLPKNVNSQKCVLGYKNFLNNFFLKIWPFFANYSFILHPSLLKCYRHVQNGLAQKCKISKTGFGWGPKIFLEIISRKKWPFIVDYSFIFHPFLKIWPFFTNNSLIFHLMLLTFYGHVQKDLALNDKFSKNDLGFNNFHIFGVKTQLFCPITFKFAKHMCRITLLKRWIINGCRKTIPRKT